MDLQHIEKHGNSYRVRFRGEHGFYAGNIKSLEDAIAIRDEHRASRYESAFDKPSQDATTRHQTDGEPRNKHTAVVMPQAHDSHHSPLQTVTYSQFPMILVLSDLHCPYHNTAWLEWLFNQVSRYDLQHYGTWARLNMGLLPIDVIVAGDVFDFGAISRFDKEHEQASVRDTLAVGADVLRWIASRISGKVYVSAGNHDRRIARYSGIPFDMTDVLALAFRDEWPENIKAINEDYCYVAFGGNTHQWMIGHPRAYSRYGGKVAADLAQHHQCSVALAHDHQIGMMLSADSKHYGYSIGHCTRPELHDYKHGVLSQHREWMTGALLLDNGQPMHYHGLMMD